VDKETTPKYYFTDNGLMLIITKDEESAITENGATIEVVPIWKWLLGI